MDAITKARLTQENEVMRVTDLMDKNAKKNMETTPCPL